MVYRSTVGDISVNCRWYIGQLSDAYQSRVNLAGESRWLSDGGKCCSARRDYFMKRTEEPWELFFFFSLYHRRCNLLLPWSRSRRILKERRVKRLLPQARSGRVMNRKGSSWHALYKLSPAPEQVTRSKQPESSRHVAVAQMASTF